MKELLKEFIDWAMNCGEDAFYIFENPDESINRFISERECDDQVLDECED